MSSPQIKLYRLVDIQRKNIPDIGNYGKLEYADIKRLDRYISGDIFGHSCCLYHGERKANYTTMSYRSKKISVLRLLYHNYVEDINHSDKIIYLCENKGLCCNLKHFRVKVKQLPPPIPLKPNETSSKLNQDPENENDQLEQNKKVSNNNVSVYPNHTNNNGNQTFNYPDTEEYQPHISDPGFREFSISNHTDFDDVFYMD